MPELPEVEHVVRALRRSVLGRSILSVDVRLKKVVSGAAASAFARKLQNSQIKGISRRGKFILIELDRERVLIAHLRMTGKFVCLSQDQQLPRYAHVIFYLDDDRRIVFCDMRQFGRMRIFARKRMFRSSPLRELAPEPLSDEFSIDYLRSTLARSRRSTKQLLLDQTKILGLGNIYASEALFLARISPLASTNSISARRAARLHQAIREVLSEAIDAGSTLRIDLEDGDGNYFGSAERFWRVYEREGEPCINCGARIRRVVQGGRSTYFCPRCQRR